MFLVSTSLCFWEAPTFLTQFFLDLIIPTFRRGFHSGAVPVNRVGIGGPGAPHEFSFHRRCHESLAGQAIENKYWGYGEHPHDVILRTEIQKLGCVAIWVIFLTVFNSMKDQAVDGEPELLIVHSLLST